MRSPHIFACLYSSPFVEHLLSSLSSSKLHLAFRTQHKYHFLHKACLYPLNLIMTSAALDLQSVLFLSISETYAILPLLKSFDSSLNFATNM